MSDPNDADTFAVEWTEDKQNAFLIELRVFIENYSLYRKKKLTLPPYGSNFQVPVASLSCKKCNTVQPFRPQSVGGNRVPQHGMMEPRLNNGIRHINLRCQGCHISYFNCYIYVDIKEKWMQKIGQYPIWLPQIPKDIERELGKDIDLYQKALRNMNEGYGIGACAYFRGLIEKYINPLLQLLLETKRENGASEEELRKIEDAIKGKDFTSKTGFAAEIAPESIKVQGINPIRKLHELLSISLHSLDEEKAMEVADAISYTLQFVIRQLRNQYEERRAYIESIKGLNKLKL